MLILLEEKDDDQDNTSCNSDIAILGQSIHLLLENETD